ncbi:MICOS complex subunit mic25a-like isoform X2 [Dunckerocampus dactyliophorus]|uniref:MICOS complex subunit mic25a-like isoform X2 n=1 Tax=Dunckerocampus dactyliophorus TaxID=161453 RepID=UPI0024050079|nr:MICOS complex subunit mic25a-like isoform X2 [Dunckerocampus dactyliophorus]
MGGNGSAARKVSFGLDEEEKVTVIEGVKLSEDVLRRMRDAQGSGSSKKPLSQQDSHKTSSLKSPRASTTEVQEEIRRNFENQQALVEEQLARLAQRERETAATVGLDDLSPSLIIEKGKAWEEHEKAKMLPADLDAWARQLERKEQELASISSFYKDQLEILEKKNLDTYQQTADQYNQAATKAEAKVRPRHTASVCTELEAKVLQCYRENPQQTLHCSSLAKQYMTCVQQAKKNVSGTVKLNPLVTFAAHLQFSGTGCDALGCTWQVSS